MNDLQGKPTLRELRNRACMEVPELANALGVRENTIYRWERGASAPPLREALRIASIFKTEVTQVNWWPHGYLD